MVDWFTGVTYLLSKTNAKNYQPITCLPTTYKMIASILKERIIKLLERTGIQILIFKVKCYFPPPEEYSFLSSET